MGYLKRMVLAGAALLAAGVWAAEASAGPLPQGGVTSQDVANVMRGLKLPTEITTDKEGDPLIYSTSVGTKFGVYFYECKNKRCASIQFAAAYDLTATMTAARVSDWNRTKRFGRAYLQGKYLYVEMDMDLERGATTEALANNFERWAVLVRDFAKYFD